MFIRRTATHRSADAEYYTTHRLVCSERVGGKVRQRTLLNLGQYFAIERAHWPLLCIRIRQQMAGQHGLDFDGVPAEVEQAAQQIMA